MTKVTLQDRASVVRDAWIRAYDSAIQTETPVSQHLSSAMRAAWASFRSAQASGEYRLAGDAYYEERYGRHDRAAAKKKLKAILAAKAAPSAISGFRVVKCWFDASDTFQAHVFPQIYSRPEDATGEIVSLLGGRDPSLFSPTEREAGVILMMEQVPPTPAMMRTPVQQAQAQHVPAGKEIEGFNLMKFWIDEYGGLRHDTWPVLFARAADAEPLKAALLAGTGDPTFWGPDDVECGASLEIEPVYRPARAKMPTPVQQAQARDLRLASTTCDPCGRELTDPVSIETGIGPVCRAAGHQRRQLSLFDEPSDYRIELAGAVICITDLARGGRTVTNDAAGVVEDLRRLGYDLDRMPVIYRDTQGNWDEMVVRNGAFLCFHGIDQERKQALRALR
ncbi:hypothetical protein HCU64_00095 [Methylobacterium sp. C25]|uniref:DUF6011 domain-containing protein n=1 Tax=Methylobacterium sp. C25 TaxID=2721622 RepID=UPI001F3C6989|nr:DUF6011 domain-containing protein [Methylobacterium sp. C25]MCE4222139.1 hypothetical protein [Methylobacterium sp. C25]